MKLITLFIFLLFAGCSKKEGDVTNEYNKYLHQFNSDIIKLGYKPIDFSQTWVIRKKMDRDSINAESEQRLANGGFSTIYISPRFGAGSDYIDKMIIYHEIGHHFLGLSHSENPRALMTAYGVSMQIGPESFENESSRLEIVREMLSASFYHVL